LQAIPLPLQLGYQFFVVTEDFHLSFHPQA
jgi:hypothetical protein